MIKVSSQDPFCTWLTKCKTADDVINSRIFRVAVRDFLCKKYSNWIGILKWWDIYESLCRIFNESKSINESDLKIISHILHDLDDEEEIFLKFLKIYAINKIAYIWEDIESQREKLLFRNDVPLYRALFSKLLLAITRYKPCEIEKEKQDIVEKELIWNFQEELYEGFCLQSKSLEWKSFLSYSNSFTKDTQSWIYNKLWRYYCIRDLKTDTTKIINSEGNSIDVLLNFPWDILWLINTQKDIAILSTKAIYSLSSWWAILLPKRHDISNASFIKVSNNQIDVEYPNSNIITYSIDHVNRVVSTNEVIQNVHYVNFKSQK